MNKSRNLFIIILLMLFWYHCSSNIPEMHYYLIDYPVTLSNGPTDPVYDVILGIEKFNALPPYKEDRLVYRVSPYEGKYYHYHRWITTPDEMITEKTIEQLRASKLFAQVVAFPGFSQVDYVLRGAIKALEEWDEDGQWYARVQITFELLDKKTDQMVWQKSLERKNLVSKKIPAEVVKGINIGVQQCVEEVQRELDHIFFK